MRVLAKVETPAVLAANATAWTADYVAARGTPEEVQAEKWRHREIKGALAIETDGKCAYCEGYVEHVAHPHVEHILPKVSRPDLAHEWSNLTTACPQCNTAKGKYYDPGTPLLDPYRDDVGDSLLFQGDFVDWRLGNARAEISVSVLKLNRLPLIQDRMRRLSQVKVALERWYAAQGGLRTILQQAIAEDAEKGEYTQSVKALLRLNDFPI